jgi:hypothetical protein
MHIVRRLVSSFAKKIGSNAEKRQVGEVDRRSNGRVYFRTNFALRPPPGMGSPAILQTDSSCMAAAGW